ncbi:MAG: hypothetical protein U0Q03_09430 [Acidimicrobiales bacterium]
MARLDPAGSTGRLLGKVRSTDWKGRAKQAVQTLKDEYEAGKRGDDTPAEPLWAGPREQLDAVLTLLRRAPNDTAQATAEPTDAAGTGDMAGTGVAVVDDAQLQADADEVADALRGVDWAKVRAVTSERGADAARTVREMAEQVDWNKVQPVATQVSTALIAAVASGQLGIGGRLGSTVARAIVDQGGLGRQVAARVTAREVDVPAEVRRVIDTTARDS